MFFFIRILYVHIRNKRTITGQKFSEKTFLSDTQPCFEILLSSFIPKIFEQNLSLYNSLLSVDMVL